MSENVHQPPIREQFYPRRRQSVPAARDFTRRALKDWGIDARADEVLLCVTELATNALLHGVPPGRCFRVLLHVRTGCTLRTGGMVLRTGGTLRVEVHDSGDGRPRIEHTGTQDESGRGLLLVAALADRWGVGGRDPGKIVWCEFAL